MPNVIPGGIRAEVTETWHGTITGYAKRRCRCARCRAAAAAYRQARGENLRIGRRGEQKRAADRTVCPECGGVMTRGYERCADCRSALQQERRALAERLWAEGRPAKEIAAVMGWSSRQPSVYIGRFRQLGWKFPVRRHRRQRSEPTAVPPVHQPFDDEEAHHE